jgi:hypothetical protein
VEEDVGDGGATSAPMACAELVGGGGGGAIVRFRDLKVCRTMAGGSVSNWE